MENLKGGVIILTEKYCRQILQKEAAAEGRSLPSEMGVLPLTFFNEILLFVHVGGQANNEEDIISWFWRTSSFPLQHSDTFLKRTLYKMFSQWSSFCFSSLCFLLMPSLQNLLQEARHRCHRSILYCIYLKKK